MQKRRCLAETTQFLDCLNNVSIDERVTEIKEREWKEADSPTEETETDLQLLSDYNQHHSLSQKKTSYERKKG